MAAHLGVHAARGVLLGVAQDAQRHRRLARDLRVGAVLDEHGLAAPLDSHRVALLYSAEVDLERRHREHVLGRLQARCVYLTTMSSAVLQVGRPLLHRELAGADVTGRQTPGTASLDCDPATASPIRLLLPCSLQRRRAGKALPNLERTACHSNTLRGT
jgi:hypothetical protein